MKKLILTVMAGSLCAVFGTAYAPSNPTAPGATPSSSQGVKTPLQTEDSRPDLRGKGATDAKGASAAGTGTASSTTGSAGATATTGADTGAKDMKKSRRAARREKG